MAKSSAKGFKQTVSDYETISADLDGKKYAPLYLLMGEERLFIDRLSDRLAEETLSDEEKAFNRSILYGKDSDTGSIINFCRQMPMLGQRQVVIVREAQQLKRIENLSVYTKNPCPTTILVLCHMGKNLDKRSQLYKTMASAGVVLESVRPRDYEIGPWLGNFFRQKGCSIDPKALGMLTEHLGLELTKISNETDKLLTALPAGTKQILPEHIENNIGISKDFNNYELTKAISHKDTGKALLIAEHFARNPKDNPLVVTMSALFTHFQRIFIINYQRWLAKARGQQMVSDAELCRMTKLTSTFFLDEYKQAANLYPNRKVFNIIGMLREYDMKSKGFDSGGAPDGELLRELLLKIFLI